MGRLINELSALPHSARQSITFDRGFEFVSWRELEAGMGTKAWFCDPQAPWQKGSVENMNKRVRRYLPRDTDLVPSPSIRAINLRASEHDPAKMSRLQNSGGSVQRAAC